ncbi:MAG TPA: 50S ribosomal protein L32 [Bacteroidetes bacterium]|nr:50S ribosomal protein L32 [Bacteroidota bacterium]
MAVPKKRTSSARRNKRRSHHALKPVDVVACENCGAMHRPHHACPECGWYKGRQVIAGRK